MFARFVAELGDLIRRGVRFEQGVIDHAGDGFVCGHGPQAGTHPGGAGLDDLTDLVHARLDAEAFVAFLRANEAAVLALLCFGHGQQDFAGDRLDHRFDQFAIHLHQIHGLSLLTQAVPAFNVRDLVHATSVSAPGKRRVQPSLKDALGQRRACQAGAEAQDVRVVVLS